MRYKTTLELLAALLIIGGYFIFVERDLLTTYDREQNRSQGQAQRGTALFTADQLPTESIDSATIQWQGDDAAVVLTKQGQDWLQTQPVNFPLNTWSVRQMIDDAARLRYTQRFEPASAEGQDLPTLGRASLLPPRVTVILETQGPDAIRQTLRLGKTTLGGRAYAMINDDPQVYLVNDALHRKIIDSKVADWRKTTIDAPTQGRAQQIMLTQSGQTIPMHKAQGRWSLGSPYSGRVDTEAVTRLLAAVGGMYITKFVADQPQDLSIYGLDQPAVVLSIHLPATETEATPQPAQTQPTTAPSAQDAQDAQDTTADQITSPPQPRVSTLRIGATEDLSNEQYFAAWSPDGAAPQVVFTLSKADVEKFNISADDLRDARMTPLAPTDVKEVSLDRAQGGKINLLRSSAGWSFAPPGPGFEADSAAVSSLVESITQTQAHAYDAAQEVALADPLATIRLAAIGAAEPDTLRIYPGDESNTYAVRRNDETVIYRVPADPLSAVFESASYYRQRTVLDLDPDQVTGVTLVRSDTPPYVFERRSDDTDSTVTATQPATTQPAMQPAATQPAATRTGLWRLVGNDNFEAFAFNHLLARVCSLRVGRWLDIHPSPAPQTTLTVKIEAEGRTTTTVAVDPVRRIGTLDPTADSPQWFELDHSIMNLLESEFRDRTLFAVGLSDIQSVTVVYEDGSVTLGPDESGRYVADDDQEVDQAAAGALFDTLAGLRVERYFEPVHVPQPPIKFEIKTRDGRSYRLAFSESEGPQNVATDGDRWFALDAETIARLRVPLVGQGALRK